jgi:hypothetical protein
MNTGHKQYQPAEKFCACALAADVRFSPIPASAIGPTPARWICCKRRVYLATIYDNEL